jgi:hypothetical protein
MMRAITALIGAIFATQTTAEAPKPGRSWQGDKHRAPKQYQQFQRWKGARKKAGRK